MSQLVIRILGIHSSFGLRHSSFFLCFGSGEGRRRALNGRRFFICSVTVGCDTTCAQSGILDFVQTSSDVKGGCTGGERVASWNGGLRLYGQSAQRWILESAGLLSRAQRKTGYGGHLRSQRGQGQ